MPMEDFAASGSYLIWLTVTGILLILELAAPGAFFLWLALAALVTGLATFVVELSWQPQIVLAAILSVALVFLARLRWRSMRTDQPNLNRRMNNHVGHTYPLETDIKDGGGKVRIDDTLWDVTGPDLPKGVRVRVARIEEFRLVVEAA